MDLEMIPFGNAYYLTPDSICGGKSNVTGYKWDVFPGYDPDVRKCFNEKCGRGGEDATECYQDGPYCQHGGAECEVNLIQACAKGQFSSWVQYVRFVMCLEEQYDTIKANGTQVDSVIEGCAKPFSMDTAAVKQCIQDTAGSAAMFVELAKATPSHPFTPTVHVTNKSGVPLFVDVPRKPKEGYGDFLLKAVCAAWTYNGGANVSACSSKALQGDKMFII